MTADQLIDEWRLGLRLAHPRDVGVAELDHTATA